MSSLEPSRPHGPDPAWAAAPDAVPMKAELMPGRGLLSDRRASKPPPALCSAPDALALLKALRRRWVLALNLGLLLAGGAAGAAWFLMPPPSYTAYSLLRVSPRPPQVVFKTLETQGEDASEFESYKQTQVQLAKSREVLDDALKNGEVLRFKLDRKHYDPLEWLSENVQVGFIGKSQLLRIALSGTDPAEAQVLVNAVTRSYLTKVVFDERRRRDERLEKIQKIYGNFQEDLKFQRQRIWKTAREIGTSDKETVSVKQQLELSRQSVAEQDLMKVKSERMRTEAELSILQANAKAAAEAEVRDSAVEGQLASDPGLEAYRGQIEAVAAKLRRAKGVARNAGDLSVQRFAAELGHLRREAEAYRSQLRPQIRQQMAEGADREAREEIAMMKRRVAVLVTLEDAMRRDIKAIDDGARSLSEKALDLEKYQDEAAQAEAAAKTIGDELQALTAEKQAEAPSRIVRLEWADLPRIKVDRRPQITGMASAAVLGIVLLGVSWCEFRTRRVNTVDEIVNGLGLRLVGALPALPSRTRRPRGGGDGGDDHQWKNLLIESIDATRTMLLHASHAEQVRVLMVTSALGGEGKSTLSCHLATSLARAGRRTLLVDCDLRSPVGHKIFDLPISPGFSELLRGEADIDEVVYPTQAGGLWLLPAGRCDHRAIQALAFGSTREIFAKIRDRYDFVVVDSPPVLPVADSLLLGQNVDAVVFSILRDVSRLPKVYGAYERLEALGIRMLGAVVAGAYTDTYGPDIRYAVPARN